MKIAIIGSGNVGGALAQKLIKAGLSVLVGAKFPLSEKSIKLATQIGEDRFTTFERAIHQSDVVILTTPPTAISSIVATEEDLSDKVIIDATNSIGRKIEDVYPTVYHYLIEKTKAKVIKCFNSTGFENILNPVYNGIAADMFMAGENQNAKDITRQLAIDCGFGSCIDFGKSDKVELLEKLAQVWINLAAFQGLGRNIAFHVLKKQ
ncbi:NADPH-dependent F420 reductase [Runella zeae]|uniref:NADPH-dependent F420 reductase n=1 Tax=Runella zeae TaxID=94255 RepID=UPI0023567D0A|nr:NAD(P)-binding domain-containing protein [Runella zeae]